MNVIVLIATGRREWGDMALNLCLSIKSNSPNQKVALIHTQSAINGLEPLINSAFDFQYLIYNSDFATAYEHAFYLKTQLYDICTVMCPTAEAFLYLDSDIVIIAGKDPSAWFSDHRKRNFTTYCNDVYDYATKRRSRPDYTFWCNVEDAKEYFKIADDAKIPQINSSFVYFKPCPDVKHFFDVSKDIWNDTGFTKYEDYKGAKPDELCLNIAAALSGMLPHQTTYRPIFFRFASENIEDEYIQHYYTAFGFAGKMQYTQNLIDWYNRAVAYYRKDYGMKTPFIFNKETKNAKDDNQIRLLNCKVRTLFREGEVENSAGGIFNPSGIIDRQGKEIIIFRKEKNMDVYKRQYSHNTGIPHLLSGGKDLEIQIKNLSDEYRVEDFRLIPYDINVVTQTTVSYSVISSNMQSNMQCRIGIGFFTGDSIVHLSFPNIEGNTNEVEKNWSFFQKGYDLFLVYSLSPFRLYKYTMTNSAEKYMPVEVKQPNLRWFHHGQFICNSTHPILIDGYYLMFFHTKENMVYYHGAVLIDAETLEIAYYTKNSIHLPLRNDGMHKTLHYVSGCAYVKATNSVRLYVGENDSHSVTVDFDKDELFTAIKKNKA